MTMFKPVTLFMAFAFALAGAPVLAGGDAAAGKKVFNTCRACHSLETGKKKIGPSLHGVFGRKAGSVDGFKYSKAMKASNVVWNEETLNKFLAKPKAFMPGTRMVFAGLNKDDRRKNLLAYLAQASK